jgi:hypothetical protein
MRSPLLPKVDHSIDRRAEQRIFPARSPGSLSGPAAGEGKLRPSRVGMAASTAALRHVRGVLFCGGSRTLVARTGFARRSCSDRISDTRQ